MLVIKPLLLLASTVTALVQPRQDNQGSQTYRDLEGINKEITKLTQAVTAWNGQDLIGALPINTVADGVKQAIDGAKARVPASPAIFANEAQLILNYIDLTLKVNVKASVQAVVAKADNFKSVGIAALVVQTLTGLKTSTHEYGVALVTKAPDSLKTKAQAELDEIEKSIGDAEKAFA